MTIQEVWNDQSQRGITGRFYAKISKKNPRDLIENFKRLIYKRAKYKIMGIDTMIYNKSSFAHSGYQYIPGPTDLVVIESYQDIEYLYNLDEFKIRIQSGRKSVIIEPIKIAGKEKLIDLGYFHNMRRSDDRGDIVFSNDRSDFPTMTPVLDREYNVFWVNSNNIGYIFDNPVEAVEFNIVDNIKRETKNMEEQIEKSRRSISLLKGALSKINPQNHIVYDFVGAMSSSFLGELENLIEFHEDDFVEIFNGKVIEGAEYIYSPRVAELLVDAFEEKMKKLFKVNVELDEISKKPVFGELLMPGMKSRLNYMVPVDYIYLAFNQAVPDYKNMRFMRKVVEYDLLSLEELIELSYFPNDGKFDSPKDVVDFIEINHLHDQ